MMRFAAVVTLFPHLQPAELTVWIERRWVQPEPAGAGDWNFADIDVARTRLVHDLRYEMDVAEDMIDLVLGLMDQVYDLRSKLAAISRAVQSQPPEIRDAVLETLRHS
jgi:chaperone modulatory protein CbpM